MEMIVMLKFEVNTDSMKDLTKRTIDKIHMKLQEYAGNAMERTIQEDGATFVRLVESACAQTNTRRSEEGSLDGPPKMTRGEGNGHK